MDREDFLTQLRRVNTERYHAWVGDGADSGMLFDAAELGGEVGELLNVVKKLEREERGWRGSRAAPDDFANECADVLICLDKLARRRGVDLAAATISKFNATSTKVDLPHRLAALAQDGVEGRFWLIVREPGLVPRRKGPFKHCETAKILREFMAANPRAFIDVLTVGTDGTPYVDHGPEVLQMADGRSMSVGRKHNAAVREAAEDALALQSPVDAKPDYEAAWKELHGHLSWVQGNKNLGAYWGFNIAAVATDLIRRAYPNIGVPGEWLNVAHAPAAEATDG